METQREKEKRTFPRCNSYFQDPITIKIEAFTLNSSFISWHWTNVTKNENGLCQTFPREWNALLVLSIGKSRKGRTSIRMKWQKNCGKKERRIKDLNLSLKLKAKRKRNSSIFVRKKKILREEEVTTFIILWVKSIYKMNRFILILLSFLHSEYLCRLFSLSLFSFLLSLPYSPAMFVKESKILSSKKVCK